MVKDDMLDTQIYCFFVCPECQHHNYRLFDEVEFHADIDLTVDVDGATEADIVTSCRWCGQGLFKSLGAGKSKMTTEGPVAS